MSASIAKIAKVFCFFCSWFMSNKNEGHIIAQQHSCLMPAFFPSMCYSWYFERWLRWVLGHESSATTPFYCLKFAPFCGRHSFLCIVAVCWWKNEAYTDWYYSILVLSVIINSVTFVTDDFIFAKMERITKLLDKNVSQLR